MEYRRELKGFRSAVGPGQIARDIEQWLEKLPDPLPTLGIHYSSTQDTQGNPIFTALVEALFVEEKLSE